MKTWALLLSSVAFALGALAYSYAVSATDRSVVETLDQAIQQEDSDAVVRITGDVIWLIDLKGNHFGKLSVDDVIAFAKGCTTKFPYESPRDDTGMAQFEVTYRCRDRVIEGRECFFEGYWIARRKLRPSSPMVALYVAKDPGYDHDRCGKPDVERPVPSAVEKDDL